MCSYERHWGSCSCAYSSCQPAPEEAFPSPYICLQRALHQVLKLGWRKGAGSGAGANNRGHRAWESPTQLRQPQDVGHAHPHPLPGPRCTPEGGKLRQSTAPPLGLDANPTSTNPLCSHPVLWAHNSSSSYPNSPAHCPTWASKHPRLVKNPPKSTCPQAVVKGWGHWGQVRVLT